MASLWTLSKLMRGGFKLKSKMVYLLKVGGTINEKSQHFKISAIGQQCSVAKNRPKTLKNIYSIFKITPCHLHLKFIILYSKMCKTKIL